MQTLLLTRSEVAQLLDPMALLPELRKAFENYSRERTGPAQKVRALLPAPGNAHILVPGLAPGIPAYSVKVNAKYPNERPAIRGILHLHDLQTGTLLALMDATYITAARTGLTGVLATDLLARKDARSVAIIGAGVQGEFHLRYLALLRSLQRASVYDIVPERAAAFAVRMSSELRFPVVAHESLQVAVKDADIIITATWAEKSFLIPEMAKKGTHLTTVGPDEPGKCEIDASLIKQSLFVCDDRELAVQIGAIGGAGLGPEAIHAELGEVLAGTKLGRTHPEQITIFGSVGLPFQDLVAAWQVYRAAQEKNIGRRLDFLD
ncbi:ornithine cyclodeaminase family protein [Candidatus Acetothermia bacterium]|nr:ornithine cyclodeaminase family protein [Candidatus Acetothermia bacterium]